MYNIDFKKIIVWLLPTFLRKPKQIAWLIALLNGVKWLYSNFIDWKSKQEFNLQINGQVVYLEKLLKAEYLTTTEHIRITDGNRVSRAFIFPKLDDKPIWLGTQIIYTKEFYSEEYVSFYVDVPAGLFNELTEDELRKMYALVDKYKVAGRIFKIRRV
jgi:hypothetical protein